MQKFKGLNSIDKDSVFIRHKITGHYLHASGKTRHGDQIYRFINSTVGAAVWKKLQANRFLLLTQQSEHAETVSVKEVLGNDSSMN